MRLLQAEPKTKRLGLVVLFQKRFEVTRVVELADARGRRLLRELVEARARGVTRPAADLEIAWAPAFAGQADFVTGTFQ